MDIKQTTQFQKITIVLETRDEAQAFWDLLLYCSSKRPEKLKQLANKLSDWFSNEAQL